MAKSEEELHAALMKCTGERGLARALWIVLDAAKIYEHDNRLNEFHRNYRICANLIEAAATTVSDL
jgi:hypothetical protein